MNRRKLDFRDFDAVAQDVKHLNDIGYDQAGEWDLLLTCQHLATNMENSISGFPYRRPWLLRKLLGPFLKRRLFRIRQITTSLPRPSSMEPRSEGDQKRAVDSFLQTLERTKTHAGGFGFHPLFDQFSDEDWRQFHLIYCSHHLSFLIPKSPDR